MKKIALTGKIGTGKSTIGHIFKARGLKLFNADQEVHKLYQKGAVGNKIVADLFPEAIKNGDVDRKILADIIFNNNENRTRLQSKIYPLIAQERAKFIQKNIDQKIIVFEIPLLFETAETNDYDLIILVTAKDSVQKSRVLARPLMTLAKLETINKLQTLSNEKLKLIDFTIDNSSDLSSLEAQVDKVIQKIL